MSAESCDSGLTNGEKSEECKKRISRITSPWKQDVAERKKSGSMVTIYTHFNILIIGLFYKETDASTYVFACLQIICTRGTV